MDVVSLKYTHICMSLDVHILTYLRVKVIKATAEELFKILRHMHVCLFVFSAKYYRSVEMLRNLGL